MDPKRNAKVAQSSLAQTEFEVMYVQKRNRLSN